MTVDLWPDSVLSRGCCQDVMAREGLFHLCGEEQPASSVPTQWIGTVPSAHSQAHSGTAYNVHRAF